MLLSTLRANEPLTLGILGGGQLAKMIAQEAYRMGLRVAIIEHGFDSPAGCMTKHDFGDGWNDETALQKFIASSDVVTLENEFVDPDILAQIEEHRPVFPSSATMRLVQDKLTQKEVMQKHGIAVPAFAAISSPEEAIAFGEQHGFPFVLKSRKFGYDGYGNATIKEPWQAEKQFQHLSKKGERQIMAEAFVNFERELAVMVARNRKGETVVYPCVETVQKDHICHTVVAPAPVDIETQKRAQVLARNAVEAVDGIGVFGVEMFVTASGELTYNEIAPRPHNSGHYTIEGCYTSQFENAVRAVLNLPLGNTELVKGAAAMVNLLGERSGAGVPDNVRSMLQEAGAALHLYGKKDSRPGRKMGHITTVAATPEQALTQAERAADNIVW